jgi:hypothetical protein
LKKTIRRELRDLNWKIDMKIVRGLPYRTEARRHKLLLMQLDRLTRMARAGGFGGNGIFGKMAGALTSFVL